MATSGQSGNSAPQRPVNQAMRINVLRGLFVLLLPLLLFARPVLGGFWGAAMEQVGVLLVIAAVLGRFWAILYSGGAKNRSVVRSGPYSMSRHPLYFFSTLGVAGLGLMSGSLTTAVLLTGLVAVVLSMTARREEGYLRGVFGRNYDDYAARVPMILPRPSLWQSPAEITVAIGPLRGNFLDALVFVSFIPLAELLDYLKQGGFYPTFPLL